MEKNFQAFVEKVSKEVGFNVEITKLPSDEIGIQIRNYMFDTLMVVPFEDKLHWIITSRLGHVQKGSGLLDGQIPKELQKIFDDVNEDD